MLELSPPEYVENLEEFDAKNLSIAKSVIAESSALFGLQDTELWERYGLKFDTPEWRQAFEAKMEVGKALRRLNRQQEDLRKEILAKGARGLHSRLASRPVRAEQCSAETAYRELYASEVDRWKGQDKQLRLLAIHNHLFADSDHYIADQVDYLVSGTYRVRSPEQLRNLMIVRDWVRTEDKLITKFAERLANLRAGVQQARREKSSLSHASGVQIYQIEPLAVQAAAAWTAEELEIINFLKNSLEMKRQLQRNPYQATVAVLVKALMKTEPPAVAAAFDVPEFHYTRMQTIQLLKDLGVYVPWENLTLYNPDLGLDAWAGKQESVSQPVETDGLDHVRHDFGNLPVYTIDDASAAELDDGISIEPSPRLDSQRRATHWVHVHVADPTSTLRPGHEASVVAGRRLTSVYFPETTWPMFPFELIEQQGWSLGSGRNGQKVLTFSARLDDDGHILESHVKAGFVRNVRKITYNMVDDILGQGQSKPNARASEIHVLKWPTGAPDVVDAAPAQNRLTEPGPSATEDLRKLKSISKQLISQRAQASGVTWSSIGSRFALQPRPLTPVLETPLRPQFFANEPITTFSLPSVGSEEKKGSIGAAQDMVAEYMILAGKLAGLHLSDRGVAGPFRGQEPPLGPKGELELLLAMRDSTGGVSMADVGKYKLTFQPAYFSVSAIDHWPMGIRASEGGYLRATSPLRRYTDLVAHWQIKSTLDSRNSVKPPFSIDDVQNMLYRTGRATAQRKKLEARAVNFWKLRAVDKKWREALIDSTKDPRAAHLLLNSLTATIREIKADQTMLRLVASVWIPELALAASLQASPEIRLVTGQNVNVNITGIVLDDYSKMYVKLRDYG